MNFAHWRRLACIVGFACMAGLAVVPASASPITWMLTNVSMPDGLAVSGSMVYDADTTTVISWNFTAGSDTFSSPGSNSVLVGLFQFTTPADAVLIFTSLSGALTDAGGTVAVGDLFYSTAPDTNGESFGYNGHGDLVATPEPAPWLMLASGLLGLLGLGYRRSARVNA